MSVAKKNLVRRMALKTNCQYKLAEEMLDTTLEEIY